MAISISGILDVLAAHTIRPVADDLGDIDFPEIGEIEESETYIQSRAFQNSLTESS